MTEVLNGGHSTRKDVHGMPLMRATVNLPFGSGLTRDVSQNVFHFFSDATGADEDSIAGFWQPKLDAFYNNTDVGSDPSDYIANYLGDYIDRNACFVNWARVEPATGDTDPVWVSVPMPLGVLEVGSGADLPLEVALCLSFGQTTDDITGPPVGPLRRRRGRVYLGPWNGKAVGTEDPDGVARPVGGLRRIIADAGKNLLNNSVGVVGAATPGDLDEGSWVVYSRAGGDVHVITGGYCDNEWDIQRRRGTTATHRYLFDAAGSADS